jgi:hypothetical protein
MSSLSAFGTRQQYNGPAIYRFFKMRQNLRDGRKHNHIVEVFPKDNPVGFTQVMLIGDLGKVSNNLLMFRFADTKVTVDLVWVDLGPRGVCRGVCQVSRGPTDVTYYHILSCRPSFLWGDTMWLCG